MSPDGRHITYAADTDGKYCVVLDADRGQAYEAIPVCPVFRGNGNLEYLAITGRRLYRITVTPRIRE